MELVSGPVKDSCSHRGICKTQRENTILLPRLEEKEIDVKAKNQLQRERLGPGPEYNREIKLRCDRLPAGAGKAGPEGRTQEEQAGSLKKHGWLRGPRLACAEPRTWTSPSQRQERAWAGFRDLDSN